MSLIVTVISQQGIIQASDSNLSNSQGATGTGQKVFRVAYLNAALSLAGSYSVGGNPMNQWMVQAINDYGRMPEPTIVGFAETLRKRLQSEMNPSEKNAGSLIHLAGYVQEQQASHPEFHFVRNLAGIDPQTGNYTGFGSCFEATEDFWTRDYLITSNASALASGGYQLYINGYPAGRIGYLILLGHLREFFSAVWNEKKWSFRPPKTLDETALLIELQLRAIGTLFSISDYAAPFIGGEIQVEKLPRPLDSIELAKP